MDQQPQMTRKFSVGQKLIDTRDVAQGGIEGEGEVTCVLSTSYGIKWPKGELTHPHEGAEKHFIEAPPAVKGGTDVALSAEPETVTEQVDPPSDASADTKSPSPVEDTDPNPSQSIG